MKGGMLLKMSSEEALFTFITNSIVQSFAKGNNGILLKLTLRQNESPYSMFRGTSFDTPVRQILLKLVAIEDDPKLRREWMSGTHVFDVSNSENFTREVNIQTNLFFKTMNWLSPICPAPLYAHIHNRDILRKLQPFADNSAIPLLRAFMENLNRNIFTHIGVMAMEFADGYNTLWSFLNHQYPRDSTILSKERLVKDAARFEILRMAQQLGYLHNDFHQSNVLVNISQDDLDMPLEMLAKKIRILLIDFGYTTENTVKFPANPTKALQMLRSLPHPYGNTFHTYPSYNWMWETIDPASQELLQNAEEARIETISKLHETSPSFPRLPLDNAIKKRFFQGIID